MGTTPYASAELKHQGDADKVLSRAAPHGRASEGWQAGGTIYSFSPQASGQNQGAWSLKQPRLLTRVLHKYVMFCAPRARKRSAAPPLAHTAAHSPGTVALQRGLSAESAQTPCFCSRWCQPAPTPVPRTEHELSNHALQTLTEKNTQRSAFLNAQHCATY